jgi:predicted Holliday junction resolvase-like endonuclease
MYNINMTLTFENLKILSSSNQCSEKAKIIVEILSKDYLRNKDDLYKIDQENLTLELIDKSRSENVIIKHIQDMFYSADQKLTQDQKTILKTKEYFAYNKLSSVINIRGIIQNIDELLFQPIDEDNLNKIHFKNGYLEISSTNSKLTKRTKCVKDFINREYKKSTKKDRDFIDSIYSQIYPKEDEKQYILSSISSAISGVSKKDRHALFLLGASSAGPW